MDERGAVPWVGGGGRGQSHGLGEGGAGGSPMGEWGREANSLHVM
jgi:hypothetical protein